MECYQRISQSVREVESVSTRSRNQYVPNILTQRLAQPFFTTSLEVFLRQLIICFRVLLCDSLTKFICEVEVKAAAFWYLNQLHKCFLRLAYTIRTENDRFKYLHFVRLESMLLHLVIPQLNILFEASILVEGHFSALLLCHKSDDGVQVRQVINALGLCKCDTLDTRLLFHLEECLYLVVPHHLPHIRGLTLQVVDADCAFISLTKCRLAFNITVLTQQIETNVHLIHCFDGQQVHLDEGCVLAVMKVKLCTNRTIGCSHKCGRINERFINEDNTARMDTSSTHKTLYLTSNFPKFGIVLGHFINKLFDWLKAIFIIAIHTLVKCSQLTSICRYE